MTGSSSSGSDRQHARNKGLAAISAITLGAGTAALVGAVGIALTLPGPASSTNASAGRVASNTFAFTSDDDSRSQPQTGTASQPQTGTASQPQTGTASQPQTGSAPTTTTVPPVATSAAS